MSDFLNGKLDNWEIRKILKEAKYSSDFKLSKQLTDDIINQFWFHDFYNSLISDKFYLDFLIKYLNKAKPKNFNRYNFYKFLFDEIFPERANLKQLAVVFEQKQTDTIRLVELNSIIKKYKGLTLKSLLDNNLMEHKTIKEIFHCVWKHHTLTEFLTAEHILNKRDPIKEFQSLAVINKEGIIGFRPSWSGVLRFLLESQNNKAIFAEWLIKFLKENPDNLDDSMTELLVYINRNASFEIRREIFSLVYDSYFKRLNWIPVWARTTLSKFIDADSYSKVKSDIKQWSNETETFVRRGNAISIIEGLLEDNSNLIFPKDEESWKKILIDFAKDGKENGVLLRHSLSALAKFKDENIIPQVSKNLNSSDSLVRDAFIQFCIESNPNSKNAINSFIEGVKGQSTIYGRHGLYLITSKDSLKYFLSKISKDEEFIRSFLDHESIFDKENGDKELTSNIEKRTDKEMLKLLKDLVFFVFSIRDYYQEGKSPFLRWAILFINKNDNNYLFEILNFIKNLKEENQADRAFYDYRDFLALLLTEDNLEKFFKLIQEFRERTRKDAELIVYIAKRLNGELGKKVYEKAIGLKFISPLEDQSQPDWEKQEKEQRKKSYESFLTQLQPAPGQYMQSVFEYFQRHRKDIEEFLTENDKARLVKLAVEEGIRRIRTDKIKVSIPGKKEGSKQFTWSIVASYYGDALRIIKEFAPKEIKKYREDIINFIPFAFSDDMSLILDLITKLKEEELRFVNKVMMDKKNDARYLTPHSYIYLMGEYEKRGCKLPNVKSILKSFINDKDVDDYDQRFALETMKFFINSKDATERRFLKKVFNKKDKNEHEKQLANIANAILITKFKDESAINWRFEQIKKPFEFDSNALMGTAHSVSAIEEELNSMEFASPLVDLNDDKYLPKFFELVDYSLKVLEQDKSKKYRDYINYLWNITVNFVDKLKTFGSFRPLIKLENFVNTRLKERDTNWLMGRVRRLRSVYVDYIGKKQ